MDVRPNPENSSEVIVRLDNGLEHETLAHAVNLMRFNRGLKNRIYEGLGEVDYPRRLTVIDRQAHKLGNKCLQLIQHEPKDIAATMSGHLRGIFRKR